jgi:DNA-binding NarL/FixJ family response regulator
MRILLLEEHPLFREALIDVLQKRLGQIETEFATTVAEALAALARAPVDLVVADFSAADVGGRPGLEGVVQAAAGASVAAFDTRTVASHARRTAAAGAKAYIPKTSTRELIDAALGVVLAGGSYFPELASMRPGDHARAGFGLSPRQAQVLELLHNGLSNSEIARALGIAVATVKLHVHAILKATGARNRTDLLVRNVRAASDA